MYDKELENSSKARGIINSGVEFSLRNSKYVFLTSDSCRLIIFVKKLN
jgi:hypothetical protein